MIIPVRNWNIKECEDSRGTEDLTVTIHGRCHALLLPEKEWI